MADAVLIDGLNFHVERWTPDEQHIAQTIAVCAREVHARLIFDDEVRREPNGHFRLRSRTRIIARHPNIMIA
jgi:hypothetical protein